MMAVMNNCESCLIKPLRTKKTCQRTGRWSSTTINTFLNAVRRSATAATTVSTTESYRPSQREKWLKYRCSYTVIEFSNKTSPVQDCKSAVLGLYHVRWQLHLRQQVPLMFRSNSVAPSQGPGVGRLPPPVSEGSECRMDLLEVQYGSQSLVDLVPSAWKAKDPHVLVEGRMTSTPDVDWRASETNRRSSNLRGPG